MTWPWTSVKRRSMPSVEQPGHTAGGPDLVRMLQEDGQADESVFRLEVPERHRGGQHLVRVAGCVAAAVAGDAADLVIKVAAGAMSLRSGRS